MPEPASVTIVPNGIPVLNEFAHECTSAIGEGNGNARTSEHLPLRTNPISRPLSCGGVHLAHMLCMVGNINAWSTKGPRISTCGGRV